MDFEEIVLRLLLAASIATCVFLVLTVFLASYQTALNIQQYGLSYSETVIINGNATTTEVGWLASVFTTLILAWVTVLMASLSRDIILSGRTKGGLEEQ